LGAHPPAGNDVELVFKLAQGRGVHQHFHLATPGETEIPTYLLSYASTFASEVQKNVVFTHSRRS
ncbi:MAG: hypothetical protein KKB70_08205, partial [Proteobacteria bacterium]|nr:hypothetical protein [Pseudomonadota bacterium]